MTELTTLRWSNEPAQWTDTGNTLTITAPPGSDYWRITHYDFIHDNAPFRYEERSGNFEARVRLAGNYHELYHHAGLMIRIDERHWIKAGIEFLNGKQTVGAVVTREYSDWSVVPLADNATLIWLRLQRFNDTVQISYSRDNQQWSMIRLAYFPPQVAVRIGRFTAAPGKEPLDVTFDHYSINPLEAPPRED